MKKYPVTVYPDHPEVHFDQRTAARMARVSEGFVLECEREELFTTRSMLQGKKGLSFTDVCRLKQIRHFHKDLGLDLEAVDLVLRYRDCIKTMQNRLEKLERRRRRKEMKYLTEIRGLHRKLAILSNSGWIFAGVL